MDITAKINGVIQRGVKSVTVDENGHLMFTLTDGAILDLGSVEGPKGDTGVGIASIARTSGTGAPGATDTYTITMTDGSTATFTVYNGKDGAGKVESVNSKTGAVNLTADDVGAVPCQYSEGPDGATYELDGHIDMVGHKINRLGDPAAADDAVTKAYVDRKVQEAGGGSGGEDGGYYAPSVDSGGNLTWTASKAGMPQVSGANIKGTKGDAGVGIASIARTSGTGAAGTTDTYTITLTDGSTSTFTVYNGKDGASGSGSSAVTSVNGKTGDVKLPVSGFGTCATAAATAIKVVDGLPEDFLVEDGVQLCVKFSNANTAAAPQLSVAGASAPIFDARTSNNVDAAGLGARTHHFVYFAGIWVLLDPANASGTVEIDTTLSVSGKAADAKAAGDAISALSEEIATETESKVAAHNSGMDTHSDIRLLISGLTDRLNALADSDDTTLDQLSEVVAYIKSNRGLIEAITTSKVSVADIIDNLTTNVANKPLSAAQGVALKALIDAISVPDKLPNPNALTFTGAVTGTYDGSAPVEVQIPSGDAGSGGDRNWKLIRTINIVSGTASYSFNTDNNGKAFKIKNFLILIDSYPINGYLEIKPNGNFSFSQKPTGKQSYPFSFMMKRLIDVRYILETSNTSMSMFERKMSGEYSAFGEFTSFAFWFSANPSSDTTMYILGEDV